MIFQENVINSDSVAPRVQSIFPGLDFSAFLFDMDGTILSSIAAAERVWTRWARRHNLDAESIVPTIHGVQTIETLRRLAIPGIDVEAEAAAITHAELDDVEGIVPIRGAEEFLHSLPAERWTIVTSATRELAMRRIAAAGLPLPALIITAEDVARGKPAPDCFLLAARRLGFTAQDCLVFEDAPAGIAAAETAGATVLVITGAHLHPVATSHVSVADYALLSAASTRTGSLELSRRAG